MRGLLKEIGYADALLARETADGKLQLIDGHLRAATTQNTIVPVLIVDLTEVEAGMLLATLDRLASLAETDSTRIAELLATVQTGDAAVGALLKRVASEARLDILNRLAEAPEPKLDQAAELIKKWRVRRGQLWTSPHLNASSTIQSVSSDKLRKIDRNSRECTRFSIRCGPGECRSRGLAATKGGSYPALDMSGPHPC